MKNRVIKSIILATLAITTVNASQHTQQTYLQTRPFLSNMPMEQTTWHTQVNKADPDKDNWFGDLGDWGMSFAATGFFQRSNNKENLGYYFGYHANTANENRDYISVTNGGADESIASQNIIHDSGGANLLTGKFFLRPTQETLGLRLDFNHNVDRYFAKLSTPITHVKTGINPNLSKSSMFFGLIFSLMNKS